MNRNPIIEILQKNRYLRSRPEVAAFDNALATLAQSRDGIDLFELYGVFTDECQKHEVMFGLVHLVESFDMKSQLKALIEVIPTMMVKAPEWTKILHYRILNDEAARKCYHRLYQSAPSGAKEAVKAVLLKIQIDDPGFSRRVGELLLDQEAATY